MIRPDGAFRARPALDHDWLAPFLSKRIGEDSRRRIVGASGGNVTISFTARSGHSARATAVGARTAMQAESVMAASMRRANPNLARFENRTARMGGAGSRRNTS
jgi:hypothetical protein